MTSRTLKLQTLIDKRACAAQVDLFRASFGDSVEVTESRCAEHALAFDWDWASRHLLGAPALAEYKRVCASAWAEYDRVRAPAWAEYDRVRAPALAEYKRVRASAWVEYKRVRASAWAEYRRVCASTWARLYIQELANGSCLHAAL
jgi:hypothetical protein